MDRSPLFLKVSLTALLIIYMITFILNRRESPIRNPYAWAERAYSVI